MTNKCTADTLCTHLAAQIVKDDKPGFTKLQQVVATDDGPQAKLHSVCYRKTIKDRYFAIVVCPWCEGEPGFYKRVREGESA